MISLKGQSWVVDYIGQGEVVELSRVGDPAFITLVLKNGYWDILAEGIKLDAELVRELGRALQIKVNENINK